MPAERNYPETDDQPDTQPSAGEGEKRLLDPLERNIEALMRRRLEEAKNADAETRIAQAITNFTGSMLFVYLHLAIFGFWILANLGLFPIVRPWDPSMVVLAMIASVEAIFLSTFVLISQNRMAAAADKRADLNLQISLLNEHETTKLIALVSAIADRLEVSTGVDEEVKELQKEVTPEAVLDRIVGVEESNSR
jgi:uncharacterized membrane protein